ncbi:prepilin peptidase [Actinomadura rugatobispora]|uniref:Prepilin peptidase n=1 Tax=Actinomadura rugatobispora TaxID=1994 RepID=A0ABW0ZQY3_9ACTN|nr:hypothetical protein GCM10010200_096610 [Actinomadura rugatobispora]
MHTWIIVAAASAGLAVGWSAAPMAGPYVDGVSRANRTAMAVATAAGWGVLGGLLGSSVLLAALLYLAGVGTLLAFIDLRVERLPDRFTLPSYGVASALLALAVPFTEGGVGRLVHACAGMAALFALFAVQAVLVPGGIGLGDVKLAGVLGLYLGWFGAATWWTGLLTMYLLGGVAAFAVMAVRRSRAGSIPFGPSMLLGTLAAIMLELPGS